MNISYLEKDKSEIIIIEELWNKLNKLHSDLSPFFSDEYRASLITSFGFTLVLFLIYFVAGVPT